MNSESIEFVKKVVEIIGHDKLRETIELMVTCEDFTPQEKEEMIFVLSFTDFEFEIFIDIALIFDERD